MKIRSIHAYLVISFLVLANSLARAEENTDPAPAFSDAAYNLSTPLQPATAIESDLDQSEPGTFWVSQETVDESPTSLATGTQIRQVMQTGPPLPNIYLGESQNVDAERFVGQFSTGPTPYNNIGVDFYSAPDFEGGLIVFGRNVAMKIGGYVKADFIYDFNPIDSTDFFNVATIPVGAPPHTNARFHARQTRLSFDTRWITNERVVRAYVEGDFFGNQNSFRLRQAYGEMGPILVGQTWTTFTDVAAAPATLDFEGSVSNVNRRQAQARWTQPILNEDLTLALAVENAQFDIETPPGITIAPRTPSPDFAGHLRYEPDWGQFQIAGLYRIVGGQPTGESVEQFGDDVSTEPAWGLNFTGVIMLNDSTKAYYQIVYGDGIGSYLSLPDAAPTGSQQVGLLPVFGWMVGLTHNWTNTLSSNFTYANNSLDASPFQPADDVQRTTYLAANLTWKAWERVRFGVEYLHGTRENVDEAVGSANRVQAAFFFDLP